MRAVPAEKRRETPLLLNAKAQRNAVAQGADVDFLQVPCYYSCTAHHVRRGGEELYGAQLSDLLGVCALRDKDALGRSETIKRMLRWASDEALQIYARMNAGDVADLIDGARDANVTSFRTTSRPATQSEELQGGVAPLPLLHAI